MRTFALIPAAGLSRRMGQPKLLLPLAGRTILEHVITALHDGGADGVLVVVGPEGTALAETAERAGAQVERLPTQTPDMRATCERGLVALAQRWQPGEDDGWLLQPADHPTLCPDVVRALLRAAAEGSETNVVVPGHDGQRGHPVWLRWRLAAEVSRLPEDKGLNHLVRAQAAQTRVLIWPDAEVLRDLDTPEDYEALVRWNRTPRSHS